MARGAVKKQTFDDIVGDAPKSKKPTESKRIRGEYLLYDCYLVIRGLVCGPYVQKPIKRGVSEETESSILECYNVGRIKDARELVRQQRELENTKARQRLERWATRLIGYYLCAVLALLVGNGVVAHVAPCKIQTAFFSLSYTYESGFISDTVMVAVLTTTTLNIIGLGMIVLRGHFQKPKL